MSYFLHFLAHLVATYVPFLKVPLRPFWAVFLHFRYRLKEASWKISSSNVVVKVNKDVYFELLPVGQIARLISVTDFELDERDFIRKNLTVGMNVINVGANVGLYAIMASKIIAQPLKSIGYGGCVLAFEPSSSTFDTLVANIRINECTSVVPLKLGVAKAKGNFILRSDITDLDADGHRSLDIDAPRASLNINDEVVEVVALAEYLTSSDNSSSLAVDNIDLLIIDVEGGELDVLLGAKPILEHSRSLTLMLELTSDIERIVNFLREFGFEFYTWNRWNNALGKCDVFEASKKGNIIAQRL